MTKLIIQIPCFNEESSLGQTLSQLPRSLPGIAEIEWLVIDDGSTDATVEVAREYGVDHIVSLPRNQGLARAFMTGLDAAVKAGADIIVNTDADNQYRAEDIPRLIQPILEGRYEIVIGSRPIDDIAEFSPLKKLLQRVGSWFVRRISNTDIPDAPSGFRAFSREAAMRLNVFSEYTYTLETIIQAGQKNMAITSVPVSVNHSTRPSRLISSIPRYLYHSAVTMVRIFTTYRPLRSFIFLGGMFFLLGFLIGVRYLFFFFSGDADGHVQSLILAALLMGIGVQVMVSGFLADLTSVNRKLLERLDWRVKQLESPAPSQQQTTKTATNQDGADDVRE